MPGEKCAKGEKCRCRRRRRRPQLTRPGSLAAAPACLHGRQLLPVSACNCTQHPSRRLLARCGLRLTASLADVAADASSATRRLPRVSPQATARRGQGGRRHSEWVPDAAWALPLDGVHPLQRRRRRHAPLRRCAARARWTGDTGGSIAGLRARLALPLGIVSACCRPCTLGRPPSCGPPHGALRGRHRLSSTTAPPRCRLADPPTCCPHGGALHAQHRDRAAAGAARLPAACARRRLQPHPGPAHGVRPAPGAFHLWRQRIHNSVGSCMDAITGYNRACYQPSGFEPPPARSISQSDDSLSRNAGPLAQRGMRAL